MRLSESGKGDRVENRCPTSGIGTGAEKRDRSQGRPAVPRGDGGGIECMCQDRERRSKPRDCGVTWAKGVSDPCAGAEGGRSKLGVVVGSAIGIVGKTWWRECYLKDSKSAIEWSSDRLNLSMYQPVVRREAKTKEPTVRREQRMENQRGG